MTTAEPAEDLIVRARQGTLTDEEEQRLKLTLSGSRELELLYHAGVEFDAEASLLAGDEARMAALVERALGRGKQRQAGRRLAARHLAVSFAVGVLSAVAVASAWEYAQRRHSSGAPAQLASAARALAAPAAIGSGEPVVTVAPARSASMPPPGSSGPALAAPKPSASTGALAARARSGAPDALSAAELFAQASAARRAGDTARALALYDRLRAEYPGSAEAEDAKVLVGNLLLSGQSPRAALREFEDYGSGALAPEALWGQAQALRKLADPGERTVLERLARDYPDSPYASAAQKRIRELSR